MFGRTSNHSEIEELWSELHDAEHRISFDIEHRLRNLEDKNLENETSAKATEKEKLETKNKTFSRRHKIYLIGATLVSGTSAIISILSHIHEFRGVF